MSKINSKFGIFAIPGNHEYEYNSYYAVIDFFKDSCIELLVDEQVIINNTIQVIGRLDYIYQDRRELQDIIAENPSSLPLIVLDHQPNEYLQAKSCGAFLQLSGHTHNGQLFPANLITKLYMSIRYDCPHINGLYQEDDFSLYVTKGYGTWGFPIRTTGNSEILQIEYLYS